LAISTNGSRELAFNIEIIFSSTGSNPLDIPSFPLG
jgi:hypothetical protein